MASSANDREDSHKKLQQVQNQIEKARLKIEKQQGKKSLLEKQIRAQDQQIQTISKDLLQTEQRIQVQQENIQVLKKEQTVLRNELTRQQQALASQVYTSFTLGQQEKLQLLFNQDDPQRLQRTLVYYQYFNRARSELIKSARDSLHKLHENQQALLDTQQKLQKNRQNLKTRLTELKQTRSQRRQLVANLQQQLHKDGRFLQRLEQDEKQLQSLISSIDEALNQQQNLSQAFGKLRGQLYWPSAGGIRKLFGRSRQSSNLRWQGVIIEADNGSYVYNIAPGRVVFSDYLRGMGNLIIIDHGDQYLSLYGHNESLFKLPGEWVEAGEIISSAGSPYGTEGVYFEIRKRGKPLNPTRWCKLSRSEG